MAKGTLTKNSPYKIAPIVGAAIIGAVGSLAGGALNRRAARKAQERLDAQLAPALERRDELMQQYQDYDFQYTNPYEDATVNLQAAQIQQQELAQNQANILESLRGGTSGAGAAALATGLARQAAKVQRQISADIGRQEQNIQMAQAQAEAEGQRAKQQFELNRMQTMLGMSMEEVAAIQAQGAQQAQNRQSATAGIIGAVGQIGSAAISNMDFGPSTSTGSD